MSNRDKSESQVRTTYMDSLAINSGSSIQSVLEATRVGDLEMPLEHKKGERMLRMTVDVCERDAASRRTGHGYNARPRRSRDVTCKPTL